MNTGKRRGRGNSARAHKRSGKHNFKKPGKRRGSSSRNKSSFSRGKHRGGSGGKRGGGRKIPTFDPSRFINTNPTNVSVEEYVPKHTFATFGLNEKLSDTVLSMGIETPTPIQDQVIPEILKGRDVIGLAETGTGKTAAFLLPLIEITLKENRRQTLIMTPTRELALQINEEFRALSKGFKLFSTVCVGGMNITPQIRSLKKHNHFMIGTPGRLLDLIERKSFDPSRTTTVVLDEADRMLDMGFIHDMRRILSKTPPKKETLFFSATMPTDAKKIVHDFLHNPVEISVKKSDVTTSVAQDVVPHGHHDKYETLLTLLKKPEFKRVIIFGSMKHSVKRLARELAASGITAESIHGNKTHGQRQRALETFKDGRARVLVATDVAARGIHVDEVSHVINYDLPASFEDYVHRIGRTGRSTKRGKALTFVPKKPIKDRV